MRNVQTEFERKPASELEINRRGLIRGWGVTDVKYSVHYRNEKGVMLYCPLHLKWREMIARCTPGDLANSSGVWDGCSVAAEWKYFSAFQTWADQTFEIGDTLDKDMIVPGNKEYCPEFCLLIPHRINMLLAKSKKLRGKYPLGVSRVTNALGYTARLSGGSANVMIHLGTFKTVQEASEAYNKAKGLRLRDFAGEFEHNPVLSRALVRQAKLYESGAANHTCHFEKEG